MGKLTWAAIPFHEPIPMATSLFIILGMAAGFDLQISGHTHGGQFWPWNLLVGYFQPFTGGLNRLKNLLVYVSRGTGYWGPPNRFIVPAEITRLRLIAA